MKKHRKFRQSLLLIIATAVSLPAVSQSIAYTYDQAGNRTSRVVTLSPPQQSSKQHVDSTQVEDMLGERNITVYPNPTRGALGVEVTGGDHKDKIRLILFSGQGVQLYNSQAQPGINPIDMTAYPKGWYILRVQAGNKNKEFKVIKE